MFKRMLACAVMVAVSAGLSAQESQTNKGEIDATSIVGVGTIIVNVQGLDVESTAVGNNIAVVVEDGSNPVTVDMNQTNSALVNATSSVLTPTLQEVGPVSVVATAVGNNISVEKATMSPVSQVNTEAVTALSDISTETMTTLEDVAIEATAVANNLDGDGIVVGATVLQTNGSPVTAMSTLDSLNNVEDVTSALVSSQGIGNSAAFQEIQDISVQQSNLGNIQAITSVTTDNLQGVGSLNASASAIGNNITVKVTGTGN